MTKCIVERVYKSLRYRIMLFKNNYYVLDVDKPYVVLIFPFLFWILPHKVYKISAKFAEELKVPKHLKQNFDKKKNLVKTVSFSMLGIMQILRVLTDNFGISNLNTNISRDINIVIAVFSLIICIILRVYLGNLASSKLKSKLDLEETKIIKIRPLSLKSEIKMNFLYVFLITFDFLFFIGYVDYGNMFMLLGWIVFGYMTLIWSQTNVREDACYIKNMNNEN
ncbi:DUF443 family protein [Clostridium botulinum]|nr:DUF443 family protein [Clostridium botulinum]